MSRGSRLLGLPLAVLVSFALAAAPAADAPRLGVSILVYHRFGPTVADAMTVRTATFRRQLAYLADHHYVVVPLRTVIAGLRGEAPLPSGPAVVITADDGHESVFTDMAPAVRERGIPVTLFIYPSAISNASYAMTWAQLGALRDTGLFEIESHTYWHPNFATEKRRLAPDAYKAFASTQMCKSSEVLRRRLGVTPMVLAWPFGIYDEELFPIARDCGYVAGVTLERRMAGSGDDIMALPRYLVTDTAVGARFAAMLPPEHDR